MTYIAGFSPTDKSHMFDILSGKIEFHPGFEVQGGRSIRAPDLKQTTLGQVSSAIQNIMDEMYVDADVEGDLLDMFIRMNNTSVEEA